MALLRLPAPVREVVLDFVGVLEAGNDLELALAWRRELGVGCARVSESAVCVAADRAVLGDLREVALVGRHGAGRLDALCRAVGEETSSIMQVEVDGLRLNKAREQALLQDTKRLRRVKLCSVGLQTLSVSRLAVSIRELDLRENNLSKVESLRGIFRLRSLNLSGNHVYASGAKLLADLASRGGCLQELFLARAQVGAEGARALLSCTTLDALDLSGNALRRDGADALVELSSQWTLRKLWISRNGIPGDRLDGLRTLSKLEFLDISHNHLGAQGATRIVAAEANHLRELVLGHNQLGHIDETLSSTSLRLRRLDVTGAEWSGENSLQRFVAGLVPSRLDESLVGIPPALLDLNLAHCNLEDEDAARPLAACMPGLVALRLAGNLLGSRGAVVLAKALEENTSVRVLDLSDNRIGPQGAEALARAVENNKTLRELELRCNRAGTTGVQAFAACISSQTSRLRRLNFAFNGVEFEASATLAPLLAASKLLYLGLADNFLSPEGVQLLIQAEKPFSMRVDTRSAATIWQAERRMDLRLIVELLMEHKGRAVSGCSLVTMKEDEANDEVKDEDKDEVKDEDEDEEGRVKRRMANSYFTTKPPAQVVEASENASCPTKLMGSYID
ncbi:Leucine-rich repeat and IQ domain-containing protein 1 [Hondaea fermentalgiana]|uniref:Leucine-rich repeat and IQ domain-containing protein 1 n=1 Tax=Hondaea fermentalgiana TaxID=2315210 RepID=A0A2R5GMZ9_9STRA|nr:Leucine-rich repeat and IQ domain-containing protein 1 [Hondaea fermentalgiana]|eukprot:GBG29244.1 Leucine-rich repeat and IQ domain-containing protein 1 [Hondaea fermentalgiana]